MLNPECVDIECPFDPKTVKIYFTDSEGDTALSVVLRIEDARRLGEMLIERVGNVKAKPDLKKNMASLRALNKVLRKRK